jgi:NitT/TauT family transport system substrate-binding protein
MLDRRLGFVFVLLLAECLCAQEKRLERFVLANAAVSESRAPLYIAKDLGLFEKYGLNVDIVTIRGTAISTAALLAGEIHMALAGSQTAITAAARGAPIVLVATVGPTENVVVARPPIATAAQLKGKTIGIGGFGVADYFVLRRIMPRLGLTADKDFSYLPTGFTSSFERINVMVTGKFDATLASRNNVARAEVYQKKVNVIPGSEEQGSGGEFYTTRELLKSRGGQMRALFRAFSEAVRVGRENREVFNRAVRRHVKEENPRLLEAYYENHYFYGPKPNNAHPPERVLDADIRDLSAAVAELKGRRAAEFIDPALLMDLEKEGFFAWAR